MAGGSGWVRTLERAPAGAARESERRLLGAGGQFRALVQPCLPGAPPPAGGGAAGPGAAWPGGAARVQTVPAQLAPRWGRGAALRGRLREAAAAGGGGGAGLQRLRRCSWSLVGTPGARASRGPSWRPASTS